MSWQLVQGCALPSPPCTSNGLLPVTPQEKSHFHLILVRSLNTNKSQMEMVLLLTTCLISDNSSKHSSYKYDTIIIITISKLDLDSWPSPSYLKDLLIQDSGTKDSNALSVDDGPTASPQRPGHLLLTVHDDGDALLIHTESNTMPPVKQWWWDPFNHSKKTNEGQIWSLGPGATWVTLHLPPFTGSITGFVSLFLFCYQIYIYISAKVKNKVTYIFQYVS